MTARAARSSKRRRQAKATAFVLTTLSLGLAQKEARAGGLYVNDRGVRANGRGGAFVAGADDADAMWYNPAGLNEAGRSVFFDVMVPFYSSSFQRKSRIIDASGNPVTLNFPKVESSAAPLPMPKLALTIPFGEKKELTAGFTIGVPFGPYSAVLSYPESVNGQPSPSRYSLISMDGSLLLNIGATIAFAPAKWLQVGAGVQLLAGSFSTKVVFNANPNDRLIGAPEDPQYDATTQLNAAPILSPSANIGITLIPIPEVRIGFSAQAPYIVSAPGNIQVKLPQASIFDNAYQSGEDVRIKFNLPAIFRVGVEVRPVPRLRAEIALVREQWSTHHSISVESQNVNLNNVTGFPETFRILNTSLVRQHQNANSYRLGGEYRVDLDKRTKDDPKKQTIDLRLGIRYEESAVPVNYVTPLTIDSNKFVLSGGAGFNVNERWRIDASVTALLFGTIEVAPEDARVGKVNPVVGNPTTLEAVNGGTYTAFDLMVGAGLNYKW